MGVEFEWAYMYMDCVEVEALYWATYGMQSKKMLFEERKKERKRYYFTKNGDTRFLNK